MCVCFQDDKRGIVVQGLTEIQVNSASEIFNVLSQSIQRRATFETQMNKFSSRSHAIFTVQVRAFRLCSACLHALVHLAYLRADLPADLPHHHLP